MRALLHDLTGRTVTLVLEGARSIEVALIAVDGELVRGVTASGQMFTTTLGRVVGVLHPPVASDTGDDGP